MKIKFLTLNVWHGGKHIKSIINFLEKENADILCFQEAREDYPLTNKLVNTYKYRFFSPCYPIIDEDRAVDEGNMIFSRFPILSTNSTYFDVPRSNSPLTQQKVDADPSKLPQVLQQATLDLNEKKLNIFNIHGIWGQDGYDSQRRIQMAKTITDEVKNRENVVLAGDFNMFPNTKSIENIEKYLRNVFKSELKSTFNVTRKATAGNWATSVVDMIFVSPNIKILDHYSPRVDVSDHLPLIAVLNI